MQIEEVNQNHKFLCDTWESLDYLIKKHSKEISQNLNNSILEVQNFLGLQIQESEQIKISLQDYSNIDQIIDKLKGS